MISRLRVSLISIAVTSLTFGSMPTTAMSGAAPTVARVKAPGPSPTYQSHSTVQIAAGKRTEAEMDRVMANTFRDIERLLVDAEAKLAFHAADREVISPLSHAFQRGGASESAGDGLERPTSWLSEQQPAEPSSLSDDMRSPRLPDPWTRTRLERKRQNPDTLNVLGINGWHSAIRDSIDAQVCTVTSTADDGVGSLRSCLLSVSNGDEIVFSADVFPVNRPATIALRSELPVISRDDLTIDGSGRGVVIDGTDIERKEGSFFSGIQFGRAARARVMGMQVTGFDAGIVLYSGTHHSTVGGDRARESSLLGQGNLLIGNRVGLIVSGETTTDNVVSGNMIGVDASGTLVIGNATAGIVIETGAARNIIGGTRLPLLNVISGNGDFGVVVIDANTINNVVVGNRIGTSIDGITALGRQDAGVTLQRGANHNSIGGEERTAGNIISGNDIGGIYIRDEGTSANTIRGNIIGLDDLGVSGIANGRTGVEIALGATGNVVGGVEPGAGNIISGNRQNGVVIANNGTTDNMIVGNLIGPASSGTNKADGSQETGVWITLGASSNVLGPRNVISANVSGVVIDGQDVISNSVIGNLIGVDVSGARPLANDGIGVAVGDAASRTLVGGDGFDGNTISGSTTGIMVYKSATDTVIKGNRIGTDEDGTTAIPNGTGVVVTKGPIRTTIGDSHEDSGNVISGNLLAGVVLGETTSHDVVASDTTVVGNRMGTDVSGQAIIPSGVGIIMYRVSSVNITSNVIGGVESAIVVSGTHAIEMTRNHIGVSKDGRIKLPNRDAGVIIGKTSQSTSIGSGHVTDMNTIAHNNFHGVFIQSHLDNTVSVNRIYANHLAAISFPDSPTASPKIETIDGRRREIIGNACPGCIVEIYGNRNPELQMETFIASVRADPNGEFRHRLSEHGDVHFVTAIARSGNGVMSELAAPHRIHVWATAFLPYLARMHLAYDSLQATTSTSNSTMLEEFNGRSSPSDFIRLSTATKSMPAPASGSRLDRR